MATIQELIDRAVGKTGIFRIPSWWMHKILSMMVDELDSVITQFHEFNNDFNDDFAI